MISDQQESEEKPVKHKIMSEISSFSELNLGEDLQKTITSMGWVSPTPIQAKCLPYTTVGRDVAGFAQTGTGKTAVFLISIAHIIREKIKINEKELRKGPASVVLVPTRELAMQIQQEAHSLFEPIGLSAVVVFGGVDIEKQLREIAKLPDILVATPGRLKDIAKRGSIDFSSVSVFVCDEADRMFDMGFIDDVEFFLKRIPENSQKLLFSATTSPEVEELAFKYLNHPEYISANPESITPEKIVQKGIICEANQKLPIIMGLLKEETPNCAIIFVNTKVTAEWLQFKLLGNGIETDLITGDLPQNKRMRLIERIKAEEVKALIATDVLSRGLHIAGVTHVFNFDLPDDPQNYVHRIGRTARAGASGIAYSLVCDDYGANLSAINDILGDALAVKTTWFDQRFLEYKDVAGNPYKDKDFQENSRSSMPSKGGARRGEARPSHNKTGASKDNLQDRSKDNRKRPPEANKGQNPKRQRQRDNANPKRRDADGFERKNPAKSTASDKVIVAEKQPSFFGLVKKTFSALFGGR